MSKSRTLLALAAAAAALAAVNDIRRRKAEARHPPAGRFVEVGGVRLHVVEFGEGDPVVLLHGNGSASSEILASGLADRLARRHRVIAIDRPGFGYSTRPGGAAWTPQRQALLLRDAFRALGLARPVVYGHSFGAMVAAALALDHPDAVGGVVLASGYYHPTPRIDAVLAGGPALPVIGPLLQHTILPLIARLSWPSAVERIFAPQPVPEAFRRALPASMALRPSALRASYGDAAAMVPAAVHFGERLGSIGVPVVIVAGLDDQMVDTEAQSVALYHEIRGARLHLLARTGHMVHHADPDRVADAIAEAHLLSRAAEGIPPRHRFSAGAH